MIAVGEGTATISANVNGQKITKEITVVKDNARKIAQELTSLTVENGRVDFPTVDGYSFSVFSSDLEKVIAKDGSVNLPIEDQEVALVVTVSKDGSEDSANTDEIKVMVKGSRDKYELLEKRIKEIEETDWTVYKPGTVKTFKEKLQAVKESLNAEVLLVSEVEKAGENLEAAFKGLEIKSDKKTLDALIKELEELDTKVYTEVSVARVEKALEKAETVSENEDASEAEVNDAVQALYEAKLGLVEQINYDNLKDRIEEIEKEDLSIYSEATAARLKEQIAEAKEALKNENITEEERKSYIETIERKSERLKNLIEDLFEMSKATSKNIQLNIVEVDIVELMKQTQFELSDKIEESSLKFKWNLPNEKVIIKLDSQKTFRVFENLLMNIVKYAMPNSRVFIDIINEEDKVSIVLKNMSANEMDFTAEEIVERFARGDRSRNTEGSGLGLAISKSFVELQGGSFKIEIDGDLFKVKIDFSK